MQKKVIFLYIFFFTGFISICFSANNKSDTEIKSLADSLFTAKEYTNAQDFYLELYQNRKIESNDLLLKLALTYEGLGNISSAIYYLKKYSKHSPTLDVELHIEQLANNNSLIGYKITDQEKFQLYLSKYKLSICLSFLSITISIALLLYFNYYKKNIKSTPLLISVSIFIALTFLSIYFIDNTTSAIIKKDCLLMAEPSAGSKLQKQINAGHRIIIIDEKDIWYRIELNEEFFYIRKNNVIII